MSTDRIEKKVVLKAPLERVWRAVSDATEFGRWFGVEFSGPFVAGQKLTGKIVPTVADPEVAKMQEAYRGFPFEFAVGRIEPMRRIELHWHPYAVDKELDYSKEPMTDIVIELREVPGGTELSLTESGFDRIPIARRARAFEMNDGGWTHQMELIAKYLVMFPK